MERNEKLMLALLLICAGVILNLLVRIVEKMEFAELYMGDIARKLAWDHARKAVEKSEEAK